MAFNEIQLARALQADRERRFASQLSIRHPLPGVLPAPRRWRRDDRPRLRWSWQHPRPVFPVGYGR